MPEAAADSAVQPDPSGSLLFGRLVNNDDGSLKTNGKGGYFVTAPYTGNDVTRKVGRLAAGGLCTATVLDSPSGALAITARHCVDDDAAVIESGKATFTPAWHDGQRPYGDWVVDKAFTTDVAVDGSVPDVAVLAIRPAEGTDRVVSAATGGGLRVHPALSSTRSVQSTLLGYPGPAPYNGVLMSACVGDYTYFPDKGRAAVQRVTGQSECHVGGGSSGGPYVTDTAAGPQIITVLNSDGGSAISSVAPGLITEAESWVLAEYPNLARGGGLPSTGSGS
ncbi:trypsin-like serine peptidase [Nocardia fluminea]|uniref:trypsin-like serine peptidase n=1 Tax=Nocardia fluminea TaxID=134984 RepID=UPI0033D8ECD2